MLGPHVGNRGWRAAGRCAGRTAAGISGRLAQRDDVGDGVGKDGARSLFISGAMERARVGGVSCSYQSQKSRNTWSRILAVSRLR